MLTKAARSMNPLAYSRLRPPSVRSAPCERRRTGYHGCSRRAHQIGEIAVVRGSDFRFFQVDAHIRFLHAEVRINIRKEIAPDAAVQHRSSSLFSRHRIQQKHGGQFPVADGIFRQFEDELILLWKGILDALQYEHSKIAVIAQRPEYLPGSIVREETDDHDAELHFFQMFAASR